MRHRGRRGAMWAAGVTGAAALAASAPAEAQTIEVEVEAYTETDPVVVGASVGAIAPQAFNELDSFAILGVEGGYALPVAERRVVVTAGLLYSQPPASGGGSDDRLSGGSYSWDLDQQMLIVEAGGAFRILPPGGPVTPFAYATGRVYLLETSLDGESAAAADFGEHSESFTEVGGAVGGGAEVPLGPGALTGTIGIGISDMNQKLTGDSNTGALEVSVGYRVFL